MEIIARMCGTIGMFIGCPAAAVCPRRELTDTLLGDDEPAAEGSQGYRSPFRSWYERSTVRSQPRRVLSAAETAQHFFSPDLVPVARHPLVRGLAPERFRTLLVQHLYRYLDFTSRLEHVVVNRTVLGIAHDTLGLRLPEAMRLDAYKIYCDEAYHALFSADLIVQVRDATGIRPALSPEPFFLHRLAAVRAAADERTKPLVDLMFVIISETLISATLAEVPDDPEVAGAVRAVLRDHLADEGRHHRYFALFLQQLWTQLDHGDRRAAALLVPALVDCFLRPDESAVRDDLLAAGLSRSDSEQVIAEVFPPDLVQGYTWSTTRQMVRYFAQLGALDDPEVEAVFAAGGLV
jgi:hypothetical protein